jgi:hypothetical protein
MTIHRATKEVLSGFAAKLDLNSDTWIGSRLVGVNQDRFSATNILNSSKIDKLSIWEAQYLYQ